MSCESYTLAYTHRKVSRHNGTSRAIFPELLISNSRVTERAKRLWNGFPINILHVERELIRRTHIFIVYYSIYYSTEQFTDSLMLICLYREKLVDQ